MYLSMNSETLTNEAMRKKPGTLAYELAESLNDELLALTETSEELETEAEDAANQKIDCCSEAVYRMEQIESLLQNLPEDINSNEVIQTALELLNEAVAYFNDIGN